MSEPCVPGIVVVDERKGWRRMADAVWSMAVT